MASIVRFRNGWRAYLYIDGKRLTKTFRLKADAKAWSERVDVKGSGMTFQIAAERFLKWKLPKLTSIPNQRTYDQSIREHVLPVIGGHKLTELTRQTLVSLVRGIAEKGLVETAHRVGQRVCAILDHAVDHGDIETHSARGLSRVLPSKEKRRMPAVPSTDLPALLQAIQTYNEPVTRIGLQLLAHTFLRTTELIGSRWDELKDDVLVVAGERMKRRLPHVVPISPVVKGLLLELEPMTGDSPFLLASPANPLVPISNNTLLFALYRLGYRGRMTGHGFRAVASTLLNESGLWSRDAIERQLAHRETDQVREAYMRAEFLAERRKLMAWYSDHLLALAATKAS